MNLNKYKNIKLTKNYLKMKFFFKKKLPLKI